MSSPNLVRARLPAAVPAPSRPLWARAPTRRCTPVLTRACCRWWAARRWKVWIEVSGSGTAECDGVYRPSTAPEKVSESGTKSSPGYWNGKPAWDRADGRARRNPSLSYSASYKAWRLARLDGHLAYTIYTEGELPTNRPWDCYVTGKGVEMAVAPAPKITVHAADPRPLASPSVVVALLSMGLLLARRGGYV
jgi:hypothetical protein